MSNITRQQQADLAVDAYETRKITKPGESITIYGVGIILTPLERKQKKAKILKETKI